MAQPLILTLQLDAASEKVFPALRTRYFPQAERHISGEFGERGGVCIVAV